MSAGNLFFLLCGVVCLVGALVTIMARNPIRGAVGLLATILGIAGLFLKLSAQFLAAIQLIVYAGAVVVLFVFVIMLLGPDAGHASSRPSHTKLSRALASVLMLALAGITMGLLGATDLMPTPFRAARPDHGSIEAVGGLLFSKGIVPFELATALLVVAVIGAIAVARAKPQAKPKQQAEGETKRLFAGPIHPRDTGRPLPKEPTG